MKKLILYVLLAIVAGGAFAQSNYEYPFDNVTHKITFRDTIITQLDSITATNKILDYLYSNYKDVRPVANKAYTTNQFEVHTKNLAGKISHSQQNLLGVLHYNVTVQFNKGYMILNRSNFQFIGAEKSNLINPIYGQKTKMPDKPLEQQKLNKEEVFFYLSEEKVIFSRLMAEK